MPTYDQAMEALRRADAAGNAADARRLANMAQSLRGASQVQPLPNQQPNPVDVSFGGGVARSALQGATFGAGDELVAGATTIGNVVADPSRFGQAGQIYDNVLNQERQKIGQFREDSPVTAFGTEVAGAIPTALIPLGALGKAAQGGSLATRVGAGTTIGVGQGALYGFNTGEGGFENRAQNAVIGGALSGGVGAAAPVIGAGVRNVAGRAAARGASRATVATAPTVDDMAAASSKLFQRAENAGVVIKPQNYQEFAQTLTQRVAKEGIDTQVTPASAGALARVVSEAEAGVPITLERLNTVRRVIQNAAGSNDPNERRIASIMIDQLDSFIDDITPDKLIGEATEEVGPILREARQLWGRARRTEMLDDAVFKAELRADSTGSGGNVNNAIRQNLRRILDSPTKRRGFSEVELQAIEDVVRGTPTQNALRLLGKLSPEAGALPLTANILGGVTTSGLSVPLTLAGAGAKRLADAGTQQSTNLARALVARGGQAAPRAISPQSGRLAQLLAQRNAAVTGPTRNR